uniref:Reverse transcriptase Ty1/copia-type domain-containing protein n=1 Tax=Solanum lycopersicum TaxID=4081 RepID=A0A3Q7HK79_SOLLC
MADYKRVMKPVISSSPPKATMVHQLLMQPCRDALLFLRSPSLEHWKAVKMVLRYINASSTSYLQISCHFDSNLYMYADVDWMGDPNDRIFTSGYILFFGPNPIFHFSKKKQSVARSFTEAE